MSGTYTPEKEVGVTYAPGYGWRYVIWKTGKTPALLGRWGAFETAEQALEAGCNAVASGRHCGDGCKGCAFCLQLKDEAPSDRVNAQATGSAP